MALIIEAFPDHLRAIGTITVRWSSIDKLLHDILDGPLNQNEQAKTLRKCGAGKSRLEFFAARVKCAGLVSAQEDELLGSVNQLLKLADDRNLIIHGQYGMMVGPSDEFTASFSDIGLMKRDNYFAGRMDPSIVTVEHFMGHADEVYEASQPMRDYLYKWPDHLT